MTRARAAAAAADEHGPRPRRVRRVLLPILGGLAAVAVVTAVVVLAQPPTPATSQTRVPHVETAVAARGDLTEEIRVQGTLGYSTPRDLGSALAGTVTATTAAGTTVTAGGELFRVDDSPVVLMRGDLPAWRDLTAGMTAGNDVLQLEQNLAALGLFTATPDTTFTAATTRAVTAWQKSLGLARTGTIELGRVVFSPADVRIATAKATVGDENSPAVVSVTDTRKEVQALVEPSQQSLAEVGSTVTVLLPSGLATTGTVDAAGAPVEAEGTAGPTLKVPLTITLTDPDAAAELTNVSVSVLLSQVRAEDALLVPVAALLAQPGGGFAVEVVTPSAPGGEPTTQRVPVDLGTFANGQVVIAGGELSAGDTVAVGR